MVLKWAIILCLILVSVEGVSAGPNAIQIAANGALYLGQVTQGDARSDLDQNGNTGVVTLRNGDAEPVSGTAYLGEYEIQGAPNARVRVQVFGDPALSGSGQDITITKYKLQSRNIRLNSSGLSQINNAVRFRVNANQALGTYNGTYYIRARYRNPIPSGETNDWVTAVAQMVSVDIVDSHAIELTEQLELVFGMILVDPAGGEVSLRNSGMTNVSGTSEFQGTAQRAKFRISGAPGATVFVSASTGDVLTGPGSDIQLTNLTGFSSSVTLKQSTGARKFRVRGNLVFGPNQTPGMYSGTYTINVNY